MDSIPRSGRARDGIRSYRLHGDVVRAFQEVGIVILEPLRIASYLFGHLDGMNEFDNLCEVAPELPTEDQAFVRGSAGWWSGCAACGIRVVTGRAMMR